MLLVIDNKGGIGEKGLDTKFNFEMKSRYHL